MAPKIINLCIITLLLFSCSIDKEPVLTEDVSDTVDQNSIAENALYFPPISSSAWETVSPEELNFQSSEEQNLYNFLEENDSDAFMILKDGKIVVEWYFRDFTQTDNHTWNSAGKTLTAMTVGIAQFEGFLDIEESSKTYLGEGWSSMTPGKEDAITVKNHLTMTTGLDYNRSGSFSNDDFFCTDSPCLTFRNEPDSFWFYHNAPYTILDEVITRSTEMDFTAYFYEKIRDRIGMQGAWVNVGYNNLYFSNTRSMARFGLLVLNHGTWEDTPILSDEVYFEAMTNSSQNLNPAYGYLWWLNGKSSYRVPGSEESFEGTIIPNAPDDMIAALGANDQKLYVIPSKNMVILRFGDDASGGNFASSGFDNTLWERINAYIN